MASIVSTIQQYYTAFDTNRASLAGIYHPNAMMTFEGDSVQGIEAIGQKLAMFPQTAHQLVNCDPQPSKDPNDILCVVSGTLSIDGGPPLKFFETFHFLNIGGQFKLYNDFFRLVYA